MAYNFIQVFLDLLIVLVVLIIPFSWLIMLHILFMVLFPPFPCLGCKVLMDWLLHTEFEIDQLVRLVICKSQGLRLLSHYSELMGRLVCGKRCCVAGTGLLGSSLIIILVESNQPLYCQLLQIRNIWRKFSYSHRRLISSVKYSSHSFFLLSGFLHSKHA